MKFNEAFNEMVKDGHKIFIVNNSKYKMIDQKLHFFQPDLGKWIMEFVNDTFTSYTQRDDWEEATKEQRAETLRPVFKIDESTPIDIMRLSEDDMLTINLKKLGFERKQQ